jgi:hypothetical protein
MKKDRIILLFFLVILLSCKTNIHDKISEKINFEWGLVEALYFDQNTEHEVDLLNDERILSFGFEKYNHMWFQKKVGREYKFINTSYNIFNENDTLKMKISNSEDKRLNATFYMYIDTIHETKTYHRIQLSLDSENLFIIALKQKSKI